MDAVFNIKRFGNLLKREFTYSWKIFLYIVTGLVAYFIVAKLLDSIWLFKLMNLLLVIGIAIIICGTSLINKNLNKNNFNAFFTVPASNFEKWLLLWVKSVLIMPILVIATITLLNLILPSFPLNEIFSNEIGLKGIYFTFFCQSLFFFGYIYFRKRSLVNTAIAVTVLFILIYFISKLIINQIYPEVTPIHDNLSIIEILNFDGFYNHTVARNHYVVTGTTTIYEICSWIIKLIFPFGLWALSYIRFREKEI
ncbi:MAG: hypothetical protein LBR46_03560 [Prevotella sp.]|jgi:hypothetical protein|nr:hypothetical protein [Prevotella sp.]